MANIIKKEEALIHNLEQVTAVVLKYDIAPFTFVFLNPRSKNWKYVKELCEAKGKVINDHNAYIVFFDNTIEHITIIKGITDIIRGWSTAYFFINHIYQDIHYTYWIDCYYYSSQADNIDSYCIAVDSYDCMIIPCKLLVGYTHSLKKYHPTSYKEQLQALSIKRCNLCPNFDINKFAIYEEDEEDKEKRSFWKKIFGFFN